MKTLFLIFIGLIGVLGLIGVIGPMIDTIRGRHLYRTRWVYIQALIGQFAVLAAILLIAIVIFIVIRRDVLP